MPLPAGVPHEISNEFVIIRMHENDSTDRSSRYYASIATRSRHDDFDLNIFDSLNFISDLLVLDRDPEYDSPEVLVLFSKVPSPTLISALAAAAARSVASAGEI